MNNGKWKGQWMWLTPNVEYAGREGKAENWKQYLEHGRTTQARLRNQVMWPTPNSVDWKGAGASGALRDRLDYAVERGQTKTNNYPNPQGSGSLNPQWVEWLMGYPVGWTDCGDSVTPSSRKSSKH